MRVVVAALLVTLASGCASRRDEQLKFLLDELTILREALKEHREQLKALQRRHDQQDRRLQAKLELLRGQLARLEERVKAEPFSGVGGVVVTPPTRPPPVARIGPDHYRVSRRAVLPHALMRSVRIVPFVSNGKPAGFKLFAIRPGSVLGQLGLQNGDVVRTIDGQPLTSPQQALSVYTRVRTATRLTVEITRRGQAMTLRYTIVP